VTALSTNRVAALLIAFAGLVHLVLAPESMGEQAYVGVLFLLGAAACAGVAYRLWRGPADAVAWALGALTTAGMAAGFVLSRTVGLPGFHESEWKLSGIVSALDEVVFVAVAVAVLARVRPLRGRA
jgi:hypothetical protein